MALQLVKGSRLAIDKETRVATIGIGWDINPNHNGDKFDLDVTVFALDSNGKLRSDSDVVYYADKNLVHPSKAIIHSPDNRTGEGEGDDETITIDFNKMPDYIARMVILVDIYDAKNRRQNFGQVNRAYARLINTTNGAMDEQYRYDLTEDFSEGTALHIADIYRHEDGWKIQAVGDVFDGNIETMYRQYK